MLPHLIFISANVFLEKNILCIRAFKTLKVMVLENHKEQMTLKLVDEKD